MKLAWFAAATAIHLLIALYLWRRLVRDTGVRPPWRRRAAVALVGLQLTIPLGMVATRELPRGVAVIISWPAFIWMAISGLALVGLAFVDLVRLLLWLARKVEARLRRGAVRPDALADPGRRQFFGRVVGGSVMAAATGATAWGMKQALSDAEVVDVPIVLPRLPPELDGFTIVQLTDLHAGYTVGRGFVTDVVRRANELGADLFALTGDFVDGPVDLLGDAIEPLRDLRAPHGVFFVTGNHEYYAGVDDWLAFYGTLGIRALRNQRVVVAAERGGGFDLAGIDDHSAVGAGHGPDLPAALAGRDPARPLVLLAHQPRQVRSARDHGVGLQLSGHTHGGQVWPWHYIVSVQQGGLLAGHSWHGDTQLYVSRGCGYWGPPVRVGAPAEITRVILRAPAGQGAPGVSG